MLWQFLQALTCITPSNLLKSGKKQCLDEVEQMDRQLIFFFVIKKMSNISYRPKPTHKDLTGFHLLFFMPFHPFCLFVCVHTEGMLIRRVVNISLGVLIGYLSVPVVMNLLSSKQAMNTSFDPLRIVNTYGAFGRYSTIWSRWGRFGQGVCGPLKPFRNC